MAARKLLHFFMKVITKTRESSVSNATGQRNDEHQHRSSTDRGERSGDSEFGGFKDEKIVNELVHQLIHFRRRDKKDTSNSILWYTEPSCRYRKHGLAVEINIIDHGVPPVVTGRGGGGQTRETDFFPVRDNFWPKIASINREVVEQREAGKRRRAMVNISLGMVIVGKLIEEHGTGNAEYRHIWTDVKKSGFDPVRYWRDEAAFVEYCKRTNKKRNTNSNMKDVLNRLVDEYQWEPTEDHVVQRIEDAIKGRADPEASRFEYEQNIIKAAFLGMTPQLCEKLDAIRREYLTWNRRVCKVLKCKTDDRHTRAFWCRSFLQSDGTIGHWSEVVETEEE